MMKVLVLLSLVALCFATPLFSGKRVTVGEDGTVTIIGTQDREIYIYRNLFNPRKLDIVLRSPMGFTRKIEVDETNNMMDVNLNTLDKLRLFNTPREQITQADVLAHLFRQYEGIVEEPTFQRILEHIQTLVRSGLVHETVYDVLMNLEHLHLIEELKRGHQMMEDGEVMEDVLRKMMTKDVYPLESGLVHGVRDVMHVEEIVPEYLRTPLTVQENLKYKTNGLEGLWNVENLTPIQREILLQHIRQQRQMEQTLGEETMTGDVLTQELAREKLMEELYKQRLGQTEMTPFTRFMYNMRQGYNKYQEPQMQVMGFQKLIQKLKFNKVLPQQWTQGQVLPQQWMKTEVPQQWMKTEVPQQWTQGQIVPQQWMHNEVVPQQWMRNEVVPQQWTEGRVVPEQVLNQLVGLERMMEQGQILPQEYNMLKQYYQRMMMMRM